MNSYHYASSVPCGFKRLSQRYGLKAFSRVHAIDNRLHRLLSSASSTSPQLPFSVLKRIQADLVEADVNKDGKIDFEELKLILNKYSHKFKESQVEQIGELFYVGKSGSSVRHTTFLRGIQYVLAQQQPQPANTDASASQNPLQLESLDDNRCWVTPQEAAAPNELLYDIQSQFEQSLLEYVREVELLEELGGLKVLQRVSDEFYQRVVADPRLEHFFVGQNMKYLSRHPYNFMKLAFSSDALPDPQVFGKRLRKAHASLMREQGLNETHFDIMLEHFVETLKSDERGIPIDTIDTATEVILLFRDCFKER